MVGEILSRFPSIIVNLKIFVYFYFFFFHNLSLTYYGMLNVALFDLFILSFLFIFTNGILLFYHCLLLLYILTNI